jgi:hypothetical protein
MEKSQENAIEEILSELSLEQPKRKKSHLAVPALSFGIQYMIIDTVTSAENL